MRAFVDSSAWFASIDVGYRNHGRAIDVLGSRPDLVTTDHVLVETWLLVNRRLGPNAAARFWSQANVKQGSVEIVTAADLAAAWRIRQAFPTRRSPSSTARRSR